MDAQALNIDFFYSIANVIDMFVDIPVTLVFIGGVPHVGSRPQTIF